MSKVTQLIETLEKLSGQKVSLQEAEITSKLKNEFYSPVAAFEREAQRVLSFYERSLAVHPDLKGSYLKFKRAYSSAKASFKLTEAYLSSTAAEKNVINNPEIPFEEPITNDNEQKD